MAASPEATVVGELLRWSHSQTVEMVRKVELESRKIMDSAEDSVLERFMAEIETGPEEHRSSAAYVTLLALRARSDLENVAEIVARFRVLMNAISPEQAKLLPYRFAQLCRRIVQIAAKNRELAPSLVLPLRVALEKSSPTDEHICPAMPCFLAVCLMSECYSIAARVLTKHRLLLDYAETALEANDVILAQYYGGVCWLGLKNYREALRNFHLVLIVPGELTDVLVETYKKLVVASLLSDGVAPTLSKYVTIMERRIHCRCLTYKDLAHVYQKGSLSSLREFIDEHRNEFLEDDNFGLVKQLLKAWQSRKIEGLAKIFASLSLASIAERAGLSSVQEAERLILDADVNGSIEVSIDQSTKIAFFKELEEHKTGCGNGIGDLDAQIQTSMKVLSRLQSLHDEIITDRRYQQKDLSIDTRRHHQSLDDTLEMNLKTSGIIEDVEEGDKDLRRWAGTPTRK